MLAPSSSSATFLAEFADIIERVTTYAVPLFVLGDINLHLDDNSDSLTLRFLQILDEFDLIQLVNRPTHKAGHTLDVFITRNCFSTHVSVSVDPPLMSDHSLIRVTTASFTDDKVTTEPASVRRDWSSFDIDKFKHDILNSELVLNPPDNCDEFFCQIRPYSQVSVR